MRSSRMRTVRSSSRLPGGRGVCQGGVCPGGCLPGGGVSAPLHAWICLPRGYLPQCMLGYVCLGGMSAPLHAGICLPGGGVVCPSACWDTHTPPCEQNDRQVYKHYLASITLQTVKSYLSGPFNAFPQRKVEYNPWYQQHQCYLPLHFPDMFYPIWDFQNTMPIIEFRVILLVIYSLLH